MHVFHFYLSIDSPPFFRKGKHIDMSMFLSPSLSLCFPTIFVSNVIITPQTYLSFSPLFITFVIPFFQNVSPFSFNFRIYSSLHTKKLFLSPYPRDILTAARHHRAKTYNNFNVCFVAKRTKLSCGFTWKLQAGNQKMYWDYQQKGVQLNEKNYRWYFTERIINFCNVNCSSNGNKQILG